MAERRFTVRIDAEMGIGNVASAVQKIQSELSKLHMPQDMGGKISNTFTKLTAEIEKFQSMSSKGIGSTKDFNQLSSSGNKIIQIYEQLSNQVKSLGSLSDSQLKNLFPASIVDNIKKATSAFEQYENTQKKSKGQIEDLTKQISKAEIEARKLVTQKENLEKKKAVSDSTFEQMAKEAEEAKNKFEEAKAKLEELQNQAKSKEEKAGGANLARKSSTYRELVDSTIPEQEKQVANLEQAWIRVSNKKEKALSQSQKDASINNLTKDIEAANKKVEDLKNKLATLKVSDASGFAQLIAQLNQIKGIQLDSTTATIEDVKNAISGLTSSQIEQLKASFSGFGSVIEGLRAPVQNLNENMDKTKEKVVQADNALSQVDALKSRVNYFFGLTNSVYLFKRAITSALNTVKELDAVMTETAVVTDFTVGDMWEKLPEYASHANALGASIKDVYAATTLYYQQGLQTNAAMSVGVETMKMARIAGMEAAEATEAMTAALRGFNMEVNEANAVRVNDVYSELAAITAADTEQIATAMSKTASIAASANMEFETTAALLAQIIETTQEAPETAGTAMKTIIARFAEVKKLRSEGTNTGEDEEGEIIDVNKIQGALRTVGISMDEFFAGTKGLDSILLELAEKWSTLDFETQRYIATTAAGSRQQSRFIAMMSDYERTMELATAANNSAGASQQQFDKTLESMQAKLQKLSNAWNEFTMGLADNQILKAGVDALTGLVDTINKITDGLSGGSGVVKSVLNLGVALMGLKTGGAVLSGVLASISNFQGGQGFNLGKNIKNSFSQAFAGLKNIKPNIPKIDFDTAGLKAYQASLAGYQASLKQVSIAQKEYAVAIWETEAASGSEVAIQNAKVLLNQAEATSKQQVATAAAQLAAATGLEAEQAKEAVLLNAQGISLDYAVVAAKQGLTQAKLRDAATSALAKEATEEEIRAKMQEILVEKTGYIARNIGVMGRIEEIAMTKLGTASVIAKTWADKMETKGIQAKTAAMIASLGVIGLIIVAIVALIALIVVVGKALYKASPAGQLEAAKEAAEQAANAVNSAAEAYDNLKNSITALEEKYASLENLIRGTQAWRDAVAEVNGEVLALADKYPELAAFIESKDGILQFNKEKRNAEDKTYDDIFKQYEEAVTNTQIAKAAADARVIKAQSEVDYQTYTIEASRHSEQTLEKGMYTDYSKTDENGQPEIVTFNAKEITNSLAQAMASGEIDFSLENGQDNQKVFAEYLQKTFDMSAAAAEVLASELSNETKQLYNWGVSLNSAQERIEGYNEVIKNSAMEQAGLNEEQSNLVGNYINLDDFTTKVEEIKKEKYKPSSLTEEDKKEFARQQGYIYENGEFKDSSGGKVEGITNEIIASTLATADALDNLSGEMLGFASAIEKTKVKKLYKKEDGQGLTSKDFKEFGFKASSETGQYDINKDQLNQKASELYNETDEFGNLTKSAKAIQELYSSQEDFIKFYTDFMVMGMESYNKAITQLSSFGAQNIFDGLELDSGAISKISNELYGAFLTSGKDAAFGLSELINKEFSDLDPENADKFAQALSMIDWNDTDSIEGLDQILTDLGFTGSMTAEEIEALENKIKETSKATKKFDLENMRKEIQSTQDLVKDLKDREDTERSFTKEERDLILKSNPNLESYFVMTGMDEFVYVGDSIVDLIGALNQNTAALLGEYGEQVKNNANQSQKWMDNQNTGNWSGAGMEEGTKTIQVFEKIIGGALNESSFTTDGVVNLEDLKRNMELFGMGKDSGRVLDNYDFEGLKGIITEDYNKYYGAGGNIAIGNINTYTDFQNNEAQLAYSTSEKTNRSLLETAQGTGENQQYAANQIVSEAVGYSEVSDELAAYNALLDENGKKKASVSAETYDAALKEIKFATELAKAKKEMREYGKEIDESLDDLEDMEEGTEEYKDALDDMAKQTNKYLDSDIDRAFLEQGNNLELLEDALEGDADAWEQFNKNVMSATAEAMAANSDMVSQFGIDASEVANITAAMDALQFDVNGTADVSQLINEFLAAGGTASEVAAYLEQLGLTNIDLVADVQGLGSLEDYINSTQGADGAYNIPLGSIKATNVRVAPSGFSGFTGGGGRSGGGGGGGGGGSKTKWENPYDEFYNTVEDINEELRTREKLERRYQALLDKTGTKASDLVKNAKDQLKSLEKQKKMREGLLENRKGQMSDIESEYSDLSKYAWYNEKDGTIEIDWEKINKLDGSTNEKLTSRIEEYISKLEEQQELIESEEDELAAIEETVREIRDQGKDEYFDFEEQIKEALIDQRQKEIDKLSAINDSINDTNSRLIDAMQSSIDKYRQDRENERTEEELSDKQRRLAYLQQDTSGANALEIMQLQEEIDQGMEDYTDQLIDQKINELQEQNDEAAEQREKQIAIAEAQLKKWEESGEIWDKVYELMDQGMDDDGIVPGSELQNLLKEAANFEGMSELQKMDWLENLENNVAQAIQWLMVGNSSKSLLSSGQIKKGQSITFTTKDGKTVTGTVQKDGSIKTDTGEVYKDVYRGHDGKTFYTTEDYISPNKKEETKTTEEKKDTPKKEIKVGGKINAKGAKIYGYIGGEGYTQYFKDDPIYKVLDEKGGYLKVRWHKRSSGVTGWFKKSDVKAYKQGGLADFTGPAWLDGTKSKPEYILNAEQTKSFFELVDVLGSLKSGTSQSSQITGDSIYDVDINVESIGSDYDVEKLATTIKRMINDDARYRNNNAINLQR